MRIITDRTHDRSFPPSRILAIAMKNISGCSRNFFIAGLFIVFSINFAWALDDLLIAAKAGDKAKLEALIANGAEVKSEKGGMALYWAAMMGQYETVAVLIAHGANVNAQEPLNGFSTLHKAVSYISSKPVKARGEAPPMGVAVAQSPGVGYAQQMPPMDVAVAQSKEKIAELLIEHGADVNDRNKYGVTPLHEVATKEMAELLIKHGANVNAMNVNNDTPLQNAIGHSKEVVEALIAHGADVNNKNRSG